MDLLVVTASDIAPQPWRNGAGTTRELLTWPGPDRWQLRISLAEVTRDGPFSAYPGIERWFAVVQGNGVVLDIAGARHALDATNEPLRFGGGEPVQCSLVDGPTRDLNLMSAGGHGRMLPAQSGVAWTSAMPQRGIFTRVPGVWKGEPHGCLVDLAANTLLWCPDSADARFVFEAHDGTEPHPALWLGFAPGGAGAGLR
jgi:environmental stress-induced protein Ves